MSTRDDVRATRLSNRSVWWMLALVLGGILIVVGLRLLPERGESVEAAAASEPAELEPVEGTSLMRVRLTAEAAERLAIQTAPVRAGGGKGRIFVPYSAVLYDTNGETWVYTSPSRLVFVRAGIEVDRIEGDRAFLSQGPRAGTQVVTVGAAELLGTEFEVDH